MAEEQQALLSEFNVIDAALRRLPPLRLMDLLVGVTAGLGMYLYARFQDNPDAGMLGVVVLLAMVCSCLMSGISGTVIPISLRRFGVDPATASSIFLTTLTDVASMGIFLWLATLLLL